MRLLCVEDVPPAPLQHSRHLHSNTSFHFTTLWETEVCVCELRALYTWGPHTHTHTHTHAHTQTHVSMQRNKHAYKWTFAGGWTASQLNVRLADAPSQRLAPLIFICWPHLTTERVQINCDSGQCHIQVECLMTLGLMIVWFVPDGLCVWVFDTDWNPVSEVTVISDDTKSSGSEMKVPFCSDAMSQSLRVFFDLRERTALCVNPDWADMKVLERVRKRLIV